MHPARAHDTGAYAFLTPRPASVDAYLTFREIGHQYHIHQVHLGDAVGRMNEAFAVRISDAFTDGPAVRSHDGVRIKQTTPSEPRLEC